MKDYKTIAIYTFPSEYAILQHLLEQEQVRFIFQNETMISVLPFHSNAFGGIRLKVHEEDIPKAEEIIKRLNNASKLNIV
ncbi:DUF2007 domain-containing protein [Patiriisocius hiemis]|uniref:DUF2007 domain-containing protein n=1 Tax=Patiriisocius hiemis TaxID=3075604 RepID=A0ABU2YBN5_9FLAO|nr:DUF2007 domain-containing protein [Constantimarinum sp. W242]MDT0555601.1 DUF2007 domain-containing protein [Constantimarinum sp. W242]